MKKTHDIIIVTRGKICLLSWKTTLCKAKNVCLFSFFSTCVAFTMQSFNRKNLTAEFIRKERGIWEKPMKKPRAQTALFVCSTTVMASQFHWNNLFTAHLPTLKLFTQKETDAGSPEMFTGFSLSRVRHGQRNGGLWSLCKNQKSREPFLGQRHCIKEHASFHWSI